MHLDLSAFQHCIFSETPFKFFILNGILPLPITESLYRSIVFQKFDLTKRVDGSDKTYQLYNALLVDHVSEELAPDLPLVWQKILQDFLAPAYRHAVGEMIGENVSDCYIQIMMKLYQAGSYISMHTDDPEVALTHLLFLNPQYDFSNKGNLNLHDCSGKVKVRIPPNFQTSIVFPRTDHSLHSVDACLRDDSPKITLQVVFWKTKKARSLKGREYLKHD